MLNIVVPMAGRGSRFAEKGYTLPKPLIPVFGIPLIKIVIDNLRPKSPHRFIFLAQKCHLDEYQLESKLKRWAPKSEIIPVDKVTEGAACTVLLAKKYINNDQSLMIANCDQYVDVAIDNYLQEIENKNLDGLIMTMEANDPKWSFVGFNEEGKVDRVVEKQVISNEATVGIYNFKKGADFVEAAEEMIEQNLRVNNEFYVAPAYNQLIKLGAKIGTYSIGSEGKGMYGLGIPEDLQKFEKMEAMARRFQLCKS
jgi:NDP-sugar pyrophosphorylase family protein